MFGSNQQCLESWGMLFQTGELSGKILLEVTEQGCIVCYSKHYSAAL